MARSLDWEAANRKDHARRIKKSSNVARKGSAIDLVTRLQAAVKFAESPQWLTKAEKHRAQVLGDIQRFHSRVLAMRPSFRGSALELRVLAICSANV